MTDTPTTQPQQHPRDWGAELRAHAGDLRSAAKVFSEFNGTECEEAEEQLCEWADQFEDDAKAYDEMMHEALL